MGKHLNGSTRRRIREAARAGALRLTTPREEAVSRALALAITRTSLQEQREPNPLDPRCVICKARGRHYGMCVPVEQKASP